MDSRFQMMCVKTLQLQAANMLVSSGIYRRQPPQQRHRRGSKSTSGQVDNRHRVHAPRGTKMQFTLSCEYALSCQSWCHIWPPHHPATHRNAAAASCSLPWLYRLNPFWLIWGPQQKLPQWGCRDHVLFIEICLSPSLLLPALYSLPTCRPFPPLLKLFYLEAIKWQTCSEVLKCDRKDVLLSVPAALATLAALLFVSWGR